MMRPSEYRSEIYRTYREHTFGHRNDLTARGLAKAARDQERSFGPWLPTDRDAAILEIGCGVGGFLLCCRELGFRRLSGVDISPQQVEFCHELGFTEVVCADAIEYLASSDTRYDLILMSDVLEHVPKEKVLPLLDAARARLLAGARLLIRVPNLSNPLNLRTRYVDFTHEVGFTKESLGQVLRVAGLHPERIAGDFQPHRDWLRRLVFDQLLWHAFLLFIRHTLYLKHEVVRGKNLIAVARLPSSEQ